MCRRATARRESTFLRSFARIRRYVSSASTCCFSLSWHRALPWRAGTYSLSSRNASTNPTRAASWLPVATSAAAFRTNVSAVSGSRTGARGVGRGSGGVGAWIGCVDAWITGASTGGGGGVDGVGGSGSTKLDFIGTGRAVGAASAMGAEESYTRSPESISAAERRLVTFVRSRIGRRTTHQPIWMAPYRNTRNGTVEKRVGTMPFCRTKVRNVGALWLFRNTRDHVARSAHIEGSTFRTARCVDVKTCGAATVTLSRITMTETEPLVTLTGA